MTVVALTVAPNAVRNRTTNGASAEDEHTGEGVNG